MDALKKFIGREFGNLTAQELQDLNGQNLVLQNDTIVEIHDSQEVAHRRVHALFFDTNKPPQTSYSAREVNRHYFKK